ncbi:MAG: zinc ribbon domain-containing protein [Pseudomonadota bacterium]
MNTYTRCPKCNHTPLPQDQALPTACPTCGLVLAKYAQKQLEARERAAQIVNGENPEETLDEANWKTWLREHVFYVPEQIEPAHLWLRVGFLVFFAIWGVRLIAMDFRDGEIGSSFLHSPLLVFHEAGHVIFRLFGEFMMIFGGTLGQLVMPAILMGALLIQNRDPVGASIGLWLLGVSFLDVAPYAYDALDPQLMLLSGTTGEEGGHDWIYLLKTLGLLNKAHGLGWLIHKLGAIIMVTAITWGSVILWKQYCILKKAN